MKDQEKTIVNKEVNDPVAALTFVWQWQIDTSYSGLYSYNSFHTCY